MLYLKGFFETFQFIPIYNSEKFCPFFAPFLHYSPSIARQVFFPTIPSAVRPCALWYAFTAAVVLFPQIPSAVVPTLLWISRVISPLAPGLQVMQAASVFGPAIPSSARPAENCTFSWCCS